MSASPVPRTSRSTPLFGRLHAESMSKLACFRAPSRRLAISRLAMEPGCPRRPHDAALAAPEHRTRPAATMALKRWVPACSALVLHPSSSVLILGMSCFHPQADSGGDASPQPASTPALGSPAGRHPPDTPHAGTLVLARPGVLFVCSADAFEECMFSLRALFERVCTWRAWSERGPSADLACCGFVRAVRQVSSANVSLTPMASPRPHRVAPGLSNEVLACFARVSMVASMAVRGVGHSAPVAPPFYPDATPSSMDARQLAARFVTRCSCHQVAER